MQANGRLQIRAIQRLAQHAAKLAVHANVDIRFDQLRHLGQMAAQGKHHVDVGANALHQTANFGQIAGAVEGTVARTNDVDAGFFTLFAHPLGYFFHAVLGPQPIHSAVGTLPLVFIDGAR